MDARRVLDFEHGQGWAYSNSVHTLVKRIVYLTVKASFGDALQQHVLSLLALEQTFTLNDGCERGRVVHG